jgi:uncharacterized protein YbjT (DUF2867 family)
LYLVPTVSVLVVSVRFSLLIGLRSQQAPDLTQQGINVDQVDYDDISTLTRHLQGVHTVLSFIVSMTDLQGTTQKNLIDACVAAGVKRFAPSEWGTYVSRHLHCIPGIEGVGEEDFKP